MTIRIGIMGYGNLGRGVECAIKQNPDMELAAVFTRRDPKNVRILTEGAKVCPNYIELFFPLTEFPQALLPFDDNPLSFEPLVGFEPTTPRLQITCSGQLS